MGGLSGCICICYVNTCYGFLEFSARLQNDLYCVGWGVKLYSNQTLEFSGVFFGPAEFVLMLSF